MHKTNHHIILPLTLYFLSLLPLTIHPLIFWNVKKIKSSSTQWLPARLTTKSEHSIMTYGLAWSVLSHFCSFILISPNILTSEHANLFPPQALCICCPSCLECFQVKYHFLREAVLGPPTPTGVHHPFIYVTALLLSKTTVFTYLLTCFFSVSSTKTFYHKGRGPVYPPLYSQVLEWCLLQLAPNSNHTTAAPWRGPRSHQPWMLDTTACTRATPAPGVAHCSHCWKWFSMGWACQSDRLSWGHVPVQHQDFSVEAWSLPPTQTKMMHHITQKIPSGCFSVNALLDFSRGDILGLPRRLRDKESACNTSDVGSIPGWGRSPGRGNGNPVQYACQDNPMDRGAW